MAKTTKPIPKKTRSKAKKAAKPSKNREQYPMIIGIVMIAIGVFLALAGISFYMSWAVDQSVLNDFLDRSETTANWMGRWGAITAAVLLGRSGIGGFFFIYLIIKAGFKLTSHAPLSPLKGEFTRLTFASIWTAVFFGFFHQYLPQCSGIWGFELNQLISAYIGTAGTALLLGATLLLQVILYTGFTPERFRKYLDERKARKAAEASIKEQERLAKINVELEEEEKHIQAQEQAEPPTSPVAVSAKPEVEEDQLEAELEPVLSTETSTEGAMEIQVSNEPSIEIEENISSPDSIVLDMDPDIKAPAESDINDTQDLEFTVSTAEEDKLDEATAQKLVADQGEYDPKLELSNYQMPSISKLRTYDSENIQVDNAELEANKNRIVDTLRNYKIEISKIMATVGPTVTLYEIVPEAGIRISKIKNLEDDIALSLSALGIRIIAPIPGRGTIGIEVPNIKPTMVSMHSVISSSKFATSKMDLPVALGKTISNETFVVDLAKMPHLLMAGATGQGKSVGLNTILTSLLYKKHPSQVKFVLVDPKKVELTLYNKIERHYLAKLPNSEEAIITDTTKVIHTLNSLCIEMDNRYELLKMAMVRNIKEYNAKFVERKLNPENGHRFMPYIVLVIDEFADLIMTAGKEVETPIARLAQLARAIGIHLIVATQRPSVNVITGIIKANFPARAAFRVTSKIDSRTILDAPGADQLIGKGDMLYSSGNDLTRLQCAFVDTPEVETICDFIGGQRAYPEAFLLPEYEGEDADEGGTIAIEDRDAKFNEAARLVVQSQQGSASLLQRKLKLGYNRAGRIVDQLESAGVIGPFEGSKARQVLIQDEASLERILNGENE